MAGVKQYPLEKTGGGKHIPVMLAEVLDALALSAPAGSSRAAEKAAAGAAQRESLRGKHILDGTFGDGGYSRAFLDAGAKVLALDRDSGACAAGRALEAQSGGRFIMRETEFSKLEEAAAQTGFAPLDAAVLDIGVSSMQIDDGARGFSFRRDGPLDMRMSGRGVSAAAVVNALPAKELARVFHFYGEERFAGRIARMIEARRQTKPFAATLDLAQAIEALGLHRAEKIHAATRVFQALRIYVNDELGELARALFAAERTLKPGGRLIVVSFHSLEDRIVKRFFAAKAAERPASRHLPLKDLNEARFAPLFKGAKTASAAEALANPRARSAKLRAGLRLSAPAETEDYRIFGLPRLPPLNALKTAPRPPQGEPL